MNRLLAAVTAVLLLAQGQAVLAAHKLTAAEIWRKSVLVGEDVPFTAREALVVWQGDHTLAVQGRLAQASPGHYRFIYDTPPRAHGRIVWSDGPVQWQYEPSRKLLTRRLITPPTEKARAASLRLIQRNYRVRLLPGNDPMAGRKMYVIELLPRHKGKSWQKLWIDRKTFKAIRTETRYPDGIIAKIVSYQQHLKLPAKIPSQWLRPDVPPGTRRVTVGESMDTLPDNTIVARAKALRLDDDGPAGFVLQQVYVSGRAGHHTTQFVYSDGLQTLSIFVRDHMRAPKTIPPNWQTISIDGLRAFQTTTAHANYLTWHRWGRRYTAVSYLDRPALIAFVRHQIAQYPQRVRPRRTRGARH